MGARFPFPSFPRGWYVVALSPELLPSEVRTVHYFGEDIVLFRGENGRVTAVDRTCPHLGAHLGGGRVEGDCIRCPFHGWRFAADGSCVEVPYAPKIPPRARVRTWATLEQDGTIMVWYDPDGAAPTWTPPPLDNEGWTANRTIRWELSSHPQEVGENTVDCSHLGPVHHVAKTTVRSVEQNGGVMRVVLNLVAAGHSIGMPDEVNDVELDVTLHGLGQIISRTHVITAGLRTRQRIHPTPIDGDRIAIFAVANTKEMPDPGYTREIDDLFWEGFTSDFARDFPIWERKAYLERPLLAGGDGPIGAYRRWARQFYVSAGATPIVVADGAPERNPLLRLLDRLRAAAAFARPAPVGSEGGDDVGARREQPTGESETNERPRFSSVDAYFETLERRFDPTAAGELEAVFQWSLTGDRPLDRFAEVRNGTIQTSAGIHASPTVTIEMSAEDYLRMINGDLNGAFAFSTGRGRLRGPVRLAMRMQRLFPLDRAVQ